MEIKLLRKESHPNCEYLSAIINAFHVSPSGPKPCENVISRHIHRGNSRMLDLKAPSLSTYLTCHYLKSRVDILEPLLVRVDKRSNQQSANVVMSLGSVHSDGKKNTKSPLRYLDVNYGVPTFISSTDKENSNDIATTVSFNNEAVVKETNNPSPKIISQNVNGKNNVNASPISKDNQETSSPRNEKEDNVSGIIPSPMEGNNPGALKKQYQKVFSPRSSDSTEIKNMIIRQESATQLGECARASQTTEQYSKFQPKSTIQIKKENNSSQTTSGYQISQQVSSKEIKELNNSSQTEERLAKTNNGNPNHVSELKEQIDPTTSERTDDRETHEKNGFKFIYECKTCSFHNMVTEMPKPSVESCGSLQRNVNIYLNSSIDKNHHLVPDSLSNKYDAPSDFINHIMKNTIYSSPKSSVLTYRNIGKPYSFLPKSNTHSFRKPLECDYMHQRKDAISKNSANNSGKDKSPAKETQPKVNLEPAEPYCSVLHKFRKTFVQRKPELKLRNHVRSPTTHCNKTPTHLDVMKSNNEFLLKLAQYEKYISPSNGPDTEHIKTNRILHEVSSFLIWDYANDMYKNKNKNNRVTNINNKTSSINNISLRQPVNDDDQIGKNEEKNIIRQTKVSFT